MVGIFAASYLPNGCCHTNIIIVKEAKVLKMIKNQNPGTSRSQDLKNEYLDNHYRY